MKDVVEEVRPEKAVAGLQRICRIASIVLKVVLAFFCIYWAFAASTMLLSYFGFQSFQVRSGISLLGIVLYLTFNAILAALIFNFIGIFSLAAKGESPFVLSQVKRLRIISVLLLAYAIVDALISYNTALIQFADMNYGYVSTNDSAVVAVNFAPFVASAVIYAFSFVFKYGVLLQEFSDETL